MITIKELKTLNHGDYFEACDKHRIVVLEMTKKGFYLTEPFREGVIPQGRYFLAFSELFKLIVPENWKVIRKPS